MFRYEQTPSLMTQKKLFEFLEHGDEKHRAWLKAAILAFFRGDPRPDESPSSL